jgi:hypothetical protein
MGEAQLIFLQAAFIVVLCRPFRALLVGAGMSMGFIHRWFLLPFQGFVDGRWYVDGLHPSLVSFALSGLCGL